MEKRELTTRDDVRQLVHSFYAAVRQDALLGPIFNGMIHNWEAHLEHLTDFWCAQLFIDRSYNGNPIEVHRKVDAFANHALSEHHFGAWLNLWIDTLDASFQGDNVFILKNRARKMASFIHIDVFTHRSST
ncbi:group III truncated hemoglobin [Imtechella halotolerans]|uniref:Sec-independent protein translocase TatC n=1 Tax=Imtechella halotolerans K1 TaxID=946077 RepID=I0WFX4_9FLAO|nr:group III truncated hemoglobin [Imtechella halotolerans]EID75290.1 sec-independent protein translocase TatC [Imtechella halotolerans K1]WMQ63926.1 group III truncated hemoglobin [Imtechella halotolerans]